jgi:hypothetical protein
MLLLLGAASGCAPIPGRENRLARRAALLQSFLLHDCTALSSIRIRSSFLLPCLERLCAYDVLLTCLVSLRGMFHVWQDQGPSVWHRRWGRFFARLWRRATTVSRARRRAAGHRTSLHRKDQATAGLARTDGPIPICLSGSPARRRSG